MKKNLRNKIIIAALAVAAAAGIGLWHFLETRYYPPILMYHSIDDQWGRAKLSVSPSQFREQMKFLRQGCYNVIPLTKLADLIERGGRIPHNTVVITFDDGNLNNYTNAFSILKEFKIPATVFLVSDWIGKEGFLATDQIKEMSASGIEFGSHTATHPSMSGLSKEELRREIFLSKKGIKAAVGIDAETFCFPFGGRNPQARAELIEAGFKAACITFPRDDSVKLDPYELKRIKISPSVFNLPEFRAKISGYYTWIKAHRWKKKR